MNFQGGTRSRASDAARSSGRDALLGVGSNAAVFYFYSPFLFSLDVRCRLIRCSNLSLETGR
jgi:hypothetical protein